MKYFLCLFLILFCFSGLKCQEIEDNDEFEAEEVDPVDTNEEEDEEEPISDLDLIPSLNPSPGEGKGTGRVDPGPDPRLTPLTSFVSKMESETIGLLDRIRDKLTSRVKQVGSKIQETQQILNKRVQNEVTDFMQGLNRQFDG